MYTISPVLKTSRRLYLWNIVRYTFPNKAVVQYSPLELFEFVKISTILVNDRPCLLDFWEMPFRIPVFGEIMSIILPASSFFLLYVFDRIPYVQLLLVKNACGRG